MTTTITCDFDGGNIEVLNQTAPHWNLAIRKDSNSHYFQWFYFRVDSEIAQDLELRIVNAGQAAYPSGWLDYKACASTDGETWIRIPTTYDDGVLTLHLRTTAATTFLAYFEPYSTDRHRALIAHWASQPGFRHTVLGLTLDGRPLDKLTVGDGPLQVWLYARQHPGETMAEWWMEGALPFLASPDGQATALRQAATFHIVPNMNPDGSARGHLRTNAAGIDLNREWAAASPTRSPEVWHVLEAMRQSGVDFALDVHGDEAIPHVFTAGFEGIPSWTPGRDALYRTYTSALQAVTADFQTTAGYPVPAPNTANLAISSNYVAETFGAVAMTLEMPFKDHLEAPDPVRGWSKQRSAALAVSCLQALHDSLGEIAAMPRRRAGADRP